MTELCHMPGCENKLASPNHMMCLDHWKRVSPATQAAVWASYNALRDFNLSVEHIRAFRAHRASVEQAIQEAMQ